MKRSFNRPWLPVGNRYSRLRKKESIYCPRGNGYRQYDDVAAVLTALSPKKMTWLSGFDSATGNYKLLFHKRRVIAEAMKRYEGQLTSPEAALRCVGGFDLAAYAELCCLCR